MNLGFFKLRITLYAIKRPYLARVCIKLGQGIDRCHLIFFNIHEMHRYLKASLIQKKIEYLYL